MNILIVGLGEVGSHLAKVLSQEGHAVTVVDPDMDKLRRVTEDLDVQWVQGDGSRPAVLDQADADAADLLLAVSNDDNVNMLTVLFGKRMGAKKAILRVKDLTPFHGFRTFFRKNLQFDQLLSLEDLAAEEFVKTIRQNQAVEVESFVEGKVQMHRLRLKEGSSAIGAPVHQLKLKGVLIAAIDRDHDVIIPDGSTVLQEGDEIVVIGELRAIEAFEKRIGSRATLLRRVVIAGDSSIAIHVCSAMSRMRIATLMIVEDRNRVESLVGESSVTIVQGAGTDADLLREEHVGDADAFLGIADADEINLMSCQLARDLGVPRTMALVHKPTYVSIYQRLGIDVAISPRLLCANRILSLVRSGSVSTIATIEEGRAEVIEIEVQPGSKLAGKQLAKAGLPRGCLVGAIAREDGRVLVPGGDVTIEPLDNLVIFVMRENVDRVLELAETR